MQKRYLSISCFSIVVFALLIFSIQLSNVDADTPDNSLEITEEVEPIVELPTSVPSSEITPKIEGTDGLDTIEATISPIVEETQITEITVSPTKMSTTQLLTDDEITQVPIETIETSSPPTSTQEAPSKVVETAVVELTSELEVVETSPDIKIPTELSGTEQSASDATNNIEATEEIELVQPTTDISIEVIQEVSMDDEPLPIVAFDFEVLTNTLPIEIIFYKQSVGGLIDSIIWDFGDDTSQNTEENPTHSYLLPGTYTASLTVIQNGISITTSQILTIEPDGNVVEIIHAGFIAEPAIGRSPLIVNFIETASGETSYFWEFKGISETSTDANPIITYANPGEYEITQTVFDGTNFDTATGVVIVLPPLEPPTASFDADVETVTVPLTVTLTDTSQGDIDTWHWSCGQIVPTIFTTKNAQCTYTEPGIYPVVLTIEGEGGLSQSIKTIRVTQDITEVSADFIYDVPDPLKPLTVILDSTPSSGNITDYLWSISDGSVLNGNIVSHTFSEPGVYEVTLKVSGLDNSTSSYMQQISVVVLDGPIADFYTNNYTRTAPANMSFKDTSLAGSSQIVNWTWSVPSLDFSSNLQNADFIFTDLGIYEVELIVHDGNGYEGRQVKEITIVERAIQAKFDYTQESIVIDQLIQFTDKTNGKDPIEWEWDFNSEAISSEQHPNFVFETTGRKTVTLKATASDGTSDTYTANIDIIGLDDVRARFDRIPASGISSVAVEVTEHSVGNILSYFWTFGDGTEYDGQFPPIHIYDEPGQYKITLTVTGVSGAEHSTTRNVTVYHPASVQIDAMPIYGISPMRVDFNAIPHGEISNYTWDMGDGFTRYGRSPSHVYTAPGSYLVSLKASGRGGVATNSITIHVVESGNIRASFRANHYMGFAPDKICFTNLSTGEIDTYTWDFGDGHISNDVHPCHSYTSEGDFRVTLNVTGDGGAGEAISTIQMYDHAPHLINLSYEENGENSVCFFTDVNGNPSMLWLFGDGQSKFDDEPCYTYEDVGTYRVSVKVVDSNGLVTVGYKDIVVSEDGVSTVVNFTSDEPLNNIEPSESISTTYIPSATPLPPTIIVDTNTTDITDTSVSEVIFGRISPDLSGSIDIGDLYTELTTIEPVDNSLDEDRTSVIFISTAIPDKTPQFTSVATSKPIPTITPDVPTVHLFVEPSIEIIPESKESINEWGLIAVTTVVAVGAMTMLSGVSATPSASGQDCIIAIVTVQSWPHQFSTLYGIAAAYYKNGNLYTLLAEYNGIANPDWIYPGQTIIVPRQECLTGSTPPPPVDSSCPEADTATNAYNVARREEWEADQAYFNALREVSDTERKIEANILEREANKRVADNCRIELGIVNAKISIIKLFNSLGRILGKPPQKLDTLQELEKRKAELEECVSQVSFIQGLILWLLYVLQNTLSILTGSDLPKVKQARKNAQIKREKAHSKYVKGEKSCRHEASISSRQKNYETLTGYKFNRALSDAELKRAILNGEGVPQPTNQGFTFIPRGKWIESEEGINKDKLYEENLYSEICGEKGVPAGSCGTKCRGDETLEDIFEMVVIHHYGNSFGRRYPTAHDALKEGLTTSGDKDGLDVSYHYMIDKEGDVYEGRLITFRGSHVGWNGNECKSGNTEKIGILLLGDFNEEWWDVENEPTPKMVDSAIKLVEWIKVRFQTEELKGHREIPGQDPNLVCPGSKIMNDNFQEYGKPIIDILRDAHRLQVDYWILA